MRPGPDPPSPRSRRKSSSADADAHTLHATPTPTTFFLASESDMQKAMSSQPEPTLSNTPTLPKKDESIISDKDSDGSFGIQSIEDTLGEAFGDKNQTEKEDEPEEQGGEGIYRLFRRKRKASKSEPQSSEAPNVEPPKTQDDQTPDNSLRNVSPAPSVSPPKVAQHTQPTVSQPLTPLMTGNHTPFDSALPSTPKSGSFRSLRLSDEDDGMTEDNVSQAIAPSDDEEMDEQEPQSSGMMQMMGSSMPELVMPSLSMPSRRPFTARGRAMGKLKVCVAGGKGVGKSSLIRAMVQYCEDIVHVDPLSSSKSALIPTQQSKPKRTNRIGEAISSPKLVEIHASTKSYPAWWSDMEESRILRRRKSMEDTVLERNICFVDTPALPTNANNSTPHPLPQYMEALLHKNASISAMNDNDLLNVLCGSGGVQVDVVIYAFGSPSNLSRDMDMCRRIAPLSNIIPIITKADTMSREDLLTFKASVLKEFQSASIKPFLFGLSLEDIISKLTPSESTQEPQSDSTEAPSIAAEATVNAMDKTAVSAAPSNDGSLPPFAISTAPGSDDSEMDASLLMSSSYSPPLLPSELTELISLLFDPDNMQWLRHSAARKFISWRRERLNSASLPGGGDSLHMHGGALGITRALQQHRHTTSSNASPSALRPRSPSISSTTLISRAATAPAPSAFNLSSSALGPGLSDYHRASLRDHTAREERLAALQLQAWAADLQARAAAERARYADLAAGARARWLLARVADETRAGNLDAVGDDAGAHALAARSPDVAPWARRALAASASSAAEIEDERLPAWARPTRRTKRRGGVRRRGLDAADPLGLVAWQEGAGAVVVAALRLLGGGVLAGAAYVAAAAALYRAFGGSAEFLAFEHPEGAEWVAVGGQAPRWVGALVARVLWGGAVEIRYV